MQGLVSYPLVVFLLSFVMLSLATRVGAAIHRKNARLQEEIREDFGVVLAATLTLLGLIIGFSFSMATTRYDLRKTLEEAEANAIGTEIVRADLFPAADAAKIRSLLRDYLDQRLLFYVTRDDEQIRGVNDRTAQLQSAMWAAVVEPAARAPTPLSALAVAGMNDVLNSQGYTQAAWWNRIPRAAWAFMVAIAICCNLLVGYGARDVKAERLLLMVLPLVVSISFLLIADIDSPRGGVIRVNPQNLTALLHSLPPR
jgi:hypothetical protein